MFRKLFGKNRSNKSTLEDHERSNSKSNTLSKRELEESGVIVCKSDCKFSASAVMVLLDNIISPSDVRNICKTEVMLRTEGKIPPIDCEFCKGQYDGRKICCASKERQMFLLNNALRKMEHISSCTKIASLEESDVDNCQNCKDINIVPSDSTEYIIREETFRKLRKKIDNMRKYYPQIYQEKGNIIELWGKGAFKKVNRELIEFDDEATSVFWI